MYGKYFKRCLDFIVALFTMILLSPFVFILTVLGAILLKGNPFYMQLRPGKNEKIFRLIKFRSMTMERDENGELLPDRDRMTKFGNMLRKTSLDELPQIWNIFKGDMSIIGPRPKLVKDMVFYNDEQNVRSLVRPGLTGLAQVNGRNNITWEEVFEYDKYYVEQPTEESLEKIHGIYNYEMY